MSDAIVENVMAEEETQGQFARRVGLMLGYAVLSVLWFLIIRTIVVAAFSLPWLFMTTPGAAGLWLWGAQPIAAGIAAFLTLQTNIRNRALHRVLTVIVFIMAAVPGWQARIATANPYVAQTSDTVKITAYFMQLLMVVAFAAVGLVVVKRRRAKLGA